ncbi:hypothetical protein D3C86_1689620 [compost metagenome]
MKFNRSGNVKEIGIISFEEEITLKALFSFSIIEYSISFGVALNPIDLICYVKVPYNLNYSL